jgi:mycofactocin biosynthesis protein MftB
VSTEAAPDVRPAREFGLDEAWRLDERVSLRPERFGALLYHFGTRKLSFLTDPRLSAAVLALAEQPSARAACAAAGISAAELPRYRRALAALAASGTIRPEERADGTAD